MPLVCFLLPVTLFAQHGSGSYKIYYEMTFQRDSTQKELTTELTELLINGEMSLFRTQVQAKRDTFQYHKDLISSTYAYSYTHGKYRIVKDYKERNIYCYEMLEPFPGTMYHSIEPQSALDWVIEPDTMTVSNLLCQKATVTFGNRNWEAWFAADLPISDGPYKFGGLPGLIVAISDKTASWSFKLLSIENIANFDFDLRFLENSTRVDNISFYKRKRYYRDNLAQVSETSGQISFPTEESRQDAFRASKIQAAKDNNWIESFP